MLLPPRVVHRFAVATAVATYLLILIGGLVHGTGSSLACPDWPTCYGALIPPRGGPRRGRVGAVPVYCQMLLGGLVRHSGAALACTDVPLCRGSLWPDAHPTVLIQALHRLTGVAVALLVFASSIVT